ncbi:MAG: hypothetical protein ACREQ9_16895, partial [Candidatus Binatia bacterium]
LPLLSTARTLMEMMPVGPIGRMAQEVGAVLADPQRAATVIVTIPEEMAVNETIEITSGIQRAGAIALGPIVVNAVWPERFSAEEARWLLASGDGSDPLIAAGRYHVEKRRRAEEHIARIRTELRVEPVILPFLAPPGEDRPSLRRLVAALDTALPGDSHA